MLIFLVTFPQLVTAITRPSFSLSFSFSSATKPQLKQTRCLLVMKLVTLKSHRKSTMNSNKAKIRLLKPSNAAPKMAKLSKLSTNTTTYPCQLNCLMVMVVLSASGLVSPQDFAFVVFSVIYLFFLSKFAFPKLTDPMEEPPVFNPESYIVRLGPLFGGIIGIVIPIAYIFEGFIEGDKEGIRAAAPHVFLLASQVFMDGVAFSDRFSTPIRVFVPVFYNAKRIFTLVDWVKREFLKADDQEYGGSASERRLFLGRVLAVVNLVFWSYDLFFFMLPVYLPRAFRKYYAAAKSD